MKYLILIHSHPEPWGHPTSEFTPEGRAQPSEGREAGDRAFETLLTELSASGELVTAEALGSPSEASFYGWKPSGTFVTDGPFAESKEQFAGFFLIDVASPERAGEIAEQFAGPGSVVELRPVWTGE